MNVNLQQQMSIHNSWGRIGFYSRIAFGQSVAKDSLSSCLDLVFFFFQGGGGGVHLLRLSPLTALPVPATEKPLSPSFSPLHLHKELLYCALFLTLSRLSTVSLIFLFPLEKSLFRKKKPITTFGATSFLKKNHFFVPFKGKTQSIHIFFNKMWHLDSFAPLFSLSPSSLLFLWSCSHPCRPLRWLKVHCSC